jgi:hypothetical protein
VNPWSALSSGQVATQPVGPSSACNSTRIVDIPNRATKFTPTVNPWSLQPVTLLNSARQPSVMRATPAAHRLVWGGPLSFGRSRSCETYHNVTHHTGPVLFMVGSPSQRSSELKQPLHNVHLPEPSETRGSSQPLVASLLQSCSVTLFILTSLRSSFMMTSLRFVVSQVSIQRVPSRYPAGGPEAKLSSGDTDGGGFFETGVTLVVRLNTT